MRLQDEEGLKAFRGSKIRPRMSKHFRFKHNVAYFQIVRIYKSMRSSAIDNENIALFINKVSWFTTCSIAMKHDNKLGEADMLMLFCIFLEASIG